jgi:hypothetical protein
MGAETSVKLAFVGEDLEYTAENLPPGLSFDASSQSIVGVPTLPGRYTVRISATNVSGTAHQMIKLVVRTDTAKARGAHYTGLLDLEGGPISGIWSVTRSLNQLTGTYRTPLFTRSFKIELRTPPMSASDDFSEGSSKVVYEGVPIHLTAVWDKATDRLSLEAQTTVLPENFLTVTTEETGLPSHWWGGTLPYPRAGRHTALLVPGEHSSPKTPEGAGFFRLDINGDGVATFTGETSLGQLFTQSTYVSDFHSLPFFHYRNNTLALGGMELHPPAADTPALLGQLVWAKNTDNRAAAYRDGFEQELVVIGGPLPRTGKGRHSRPVPTLPEPPASSSRTGDWAVLPNRSN